MGAKTWMLVYADGRTREILSTKPALDSGATEALARKLFPSDKLSPLEDGSLAWTNPPDDEIVIGCFAGVSIVAAKEFALDYPSRLAPGFVQAGAGGTVHLHAMHSVVDWFAFAIWRAGRLERSLSLSPDSGVLEDIGAKMSFEQPYWAGEHPAINPDDEGDGYPLPFHPLDLGEAALCEFFGYQLEGFIDEEMFEPDQIPLMRYKRSRSRWKLW
jgi:hypothetical protein